MKTRNTTRDPDYDIGEVCRRIADGDTLQAIAADMLTNRVNVLRWLQGDPDRYERYKEARLERAHMMVDEIKELADDPVPPEGIPQRRLQIDTRKWIAGKLYPKYYGDKLQTELSGTVSFASALAELAAKPAPADE